MFQFCRDKFLELQDSIFLDHLVSGLLLGYLLDGGGKCKVEFYLQVFLLIGISHVLVFLLKEMVKYAKEAGKYDNHATKLERGLQWLAKRCHYVILILQFGLYLALGFYVFFLIALRSRGSLTVVEKDPCRNRRPDFKLNGTNIAEECMYCDLSTVNLGSFVFSFQTIYGLIKLVFWLRMHRVQKNKGLAEIGEEAEVVEYERSLKGTIKGFFKETVEILGLKPFFGPLIPKAMFSLSIAVPRDSCNGSILTWYMLGGVASMLAHVLDELIDSVEVSSQEAGFLDWDEFRTIFVLKCGKFVSFTAELLVYFGVSIIYFQNMGRTQSSKKDQPYYCEDSIQLFNTVVFIIFTFVLLFRILVVVAAFFPPNEEVVIKPEVKPGDKKGTTKQPEKMK